MPAESITNSRRLMSNTVLNMLHSVLAAVISFFLIRFLVQHLGEEQYGIWVLVASVFQFRILLDMGLNSAVNRYIPVCLAKQDMLGVNKVISTTFFTYCILATLLAVISIIVYFNVGRWFKIDPQWVQSAGYLVLIVGFCFSLVLPLQMSSAILSGLQRYDIINIVSITALLARTVLLVVLVLQGFGLLTVGLIFAGGELIPRIAQFYFSNKLLPAMNISSGKMDRRLFFEMTAYGVNHMLYALGMLVLVKASNIIIGIFLGTAQVSYFAISLAGVTLLSQLVQTFSKAVKPAASDLGARNDDTRLNEMAFLAQKYSLLMLIPSAGFFIVMGREFLTIWVGDAIGDPSVIGVMATVLTILVVAKGLHLAWDSNYIILIGLGEHRIFGVTMIVNTVASIISAVVCLKVFQLGLVSIAWSFFVPMVFVLGVFLPIHYLCKRKIRWIDNIRQVWLPAFAGTLPGVFTLVLWKMLAPPDSWLGLIAVLFTVAVLTVAGSWMLCLSKPERNRFINFFSLVRKTFHKICFK